MTKEQLKEEYQKCIESFDYWKDKYVLRPRTRDNWQEIVTAMSLHFECSLRLALDMYKEDRDKYIKWYNDNLETLLHIN